MYRQYLSDSWLLLHWDWQWFVTMSFPRRASRQEVMGKFIERVRELQRIEGIQVGCIHCLARKANRYHLHIVMIGFGVRKGVTVTLEDINLEKWERKWGGSPATEIETPESNVAVSDYLAIHNFEWKGDETDIYPYNLKLLYKHRKKTIFS